MTRQIRTAFPSLERGEWQVTSPENPFYNCIAWAADDTARCWWPDRFFQYHWPDQVDRVVTLESFEAAFETKGYEVCEDLSHETGVEKVAIFTHPNGPPTHAARQLESGKWTSKLGDGQDIEHDRAGAVGGSKYGSVATVMKRPLDPAAGQ